MDADYRLGEGKGKSSAFEKMHMTILNGKRHGLSLI